MLPMEKDFTHVLSKKNEKAQTAEKPRKSTIDFLMQFARAYSYEPKMPANLGNFIAN